MTEIPVAVTARNEERSLRACLASLAAAVDAARSPSVSPRLTVVLDDTTDGSEEVARAAGVEVLSSTGGLVEAQRRVVRSFPAAPFVIFSDADLRVERPTLASLIEAMLGEESLRVAYPPKSPCPPRRRHLLARALHAYNRTDGLQTRRHYFNGKLFAIRGWRMPTREELAPRLASLRRDDFYDYHAGMRVDDVYLSRSIFMESGAEAIRQVDGGRIWFRPPETFEGMYRTYRRMRMEIERLDVLFPETREVHRRWGVRSTDRPRFRGAGAEDRFLWRVFQAALVLCKARYRLERFYYRHLAPKPCDPWQAIDETKEPIPGV